MSIDHVLRSFQTSLRSIDSSARSDLDNIRRCIDKAQSTLGTSSDSMEVWTVGADLASIQAQSAHVLPSSDVLSILRLAATDHDPINQVETSKPTAKQEPPPQLVQKKTVSFHPAVEAASEPKSFDTPKTATKVRGMLSVWEDKIQKVTTPHYGKTPLSALKEEKEPLSGFKRKQIPIPEDEPVVNDSFDGPILEIPDDLLAELEGLDPVAREKRLSVLQIEIDERRKSMSAKQSLAPEQPVAPSLTGRVAAALKLFGGTTVPKRDFGLVSFSTHKSVKSAAPLPINSTNMQVDEGGLDGVAIEETENGPLNPERLEFFDAHEKSVIEIDLESDDDDLEKSHLQQVEAAQEVAQLEAAEEEMERSTWLADIEEIKLVSTPAKPGKGEKTADWSAVSQKMNLSCHLTPVVPGRRSCVAFKSIMVPLGPKLEDEQYEVTDKDTDSENELSPNSRAKKHIPGWCVNWRQKSIAQIAVDPESIFGVTVPKCELDIIFTQRNYQEMGLHRPKRVRGSSGNWTFDILTQDEVDRYRAKLGQVVRAEGVFIHE